MTSDRLKQRCQYLTFHLLKWDHINLHFCKLILSMYSYLKHFKAGKETNTKGLDEIYHAHTAALVFNSLEIEKN